MQISPACRMCRHPTSTRRSLNRRCDRWLPTTIPSHSRANHSTSCDVNYSDMTSSPFRSQWKTAHGRSVLANQMTPFSPSPTLNLIRARDLPSVTSLSSGVDNMLQQSSLLLVDWSLSPHADLSSPQDIWTSKSWVSVRWITVEVNCCKIFLLGHSFCWFRNQWENNFVVLGVTKVFGSGNLHGRMKLKKI